jgi:hypothetical protein
MCERGCEREGAEICVVAERYRWIGAGSYIGTDTARLMTTFKNYYKELADPIRVFF